MGKIKYIVLVIFLSIFFTGTVYAEDIKSSVLIDQAKKFDGKEITYTGEVIGDIMKRGNYAWINVSDGENAIGIWIPYTEAKKIKVTGSYKYIGDIIRVKGIFKRACPEHGGDFDIHASSIQIVKQGHSIVRPINNVRKYTAIILMLISFIMIAILMKRRI